MKKVFIIDNQKSEGWSDSNRSVVGVEIEEKNLSLTNIKGIDITVEGFLLVLETLQEELSEVDCFRTNPYKINFYEGMSGCKTWTMSYLEQAGNFWREKQNEILHISCFDKIPSQEFYIPDLGLIMEELLSSNFSSDEVDAIKIEEIEPINTDGYTIPQNQQG